ncbi:MAG: hypothetical protein ABFC89_05380 [Methanospirillum sp.]
MTVAIGYAVRDGDGIAIRLTAGPRRGCYRVAAGTAPSLLAGVASAALLVDGIAVGVIAPSKSLRLLRGAFCADGDFHPERAGPLRSATAFLVPRPHLRAHYDRHDGPVPVLAGDRRMVSARSRTVPAAAGKGDA